jgi:sugar phosphate isomerase/epimerase
MSMIPLAYNSNGFPFHTLDDATRILADLGYQGIALTPDVHHLDPFKASARNIDGYAALLEQLGMKIVIETGARFILDPRRKHHPTLLSEAGFEKRQDFLVRCIDMAAALGAPVVSTWSGRLEDSDNAAGAAEKLAARLDPVLDHADRSGVALALEPEPGMFVDNMARFDEIARLAGTERVRLTCDVGHAFITETEPPHRIIEQWSDHLVNVHIDDARDRRHEHLMPGEGEIDFAPIMRAIENLPAAPFVSVELSRHGHDAVEAARRARAFLAADT